MLRRALPLLLSVLVLLVLLALPAGRELFPWQVRHLVFGEEPRLDFATNLWWNLTPGRSWAVYDVTREQEPRLAESGDAWWWMAYRAPRVETTADMAALHAVARQHPGNLALASLALQRRFMITAPSPLYGSPPPAPAAPPGPGVPPPVSPSSHPPPPDVRETLRLLNWWRTTDPANAYLDVAQAYFLAGMKRHQEAAEALLRAADKPYWNDYLMEEWREGTAARGRLLPQLDAQFLSLYVGMSHLGRLGVLERNWLAPYARDLEASGHGEQAWRLRRAAVRVAELAATNPDSVVFPALYSRVLFEHVAANGRPWTPPSSSSTTALATTSLPDRAALWIEEANAHHDRSAAQHTAALAEYWGKLQQARGAWSDRHLQRYADVWAWRWVGTTCLYLGLALLLVGTVALGCTAFPGAGEPLPRRVRSAAVGVPALLLSVAAALVAVFWVVVNWWCVTDHETEAAISSPLYEPSGFVVALLPYLLLAAVAAPLLVGLLHAVLRQGSLRARLGRLAETVRYGALWTGFALVLGYAAALGATVVVQNRAVAQMEHIMQVGELGAMWESAGIRPPEVHASPPRPLP